MDFQQCVETMVGDLGELFADPRHSQEARGNKNEVEAGFITMRALVATLSAVRLEYEACKQQAVAAENAATTTSGSADGSSTPVAESPTVVGGTAVPTGEAAAVTTAVVTSAPSAAVPVPDGPAQERANRERTPPPGSRAKAIAKMSDVELAGPRKAKGQAKAKASA